MKWYLKVLRQYADFSGRASRKEYWMFCLFNFLIVFGVLFLLYIIFMFISELGGGINLTVLNASTVICDIFSVIYSLAVLIPSLAVAARRLHDVGKSGWWLLLGLIPIVGWIWLLVLMIIPGENRRNEYGQNPNLPPDDDEQKETEYPLSDDYALLHIYRRNSVKGAMIAYDVHLGNDTVFRAKNGNRTTVKVTKEGTHVLWAKTEARTEVSVNILFGREYYVRCGIKMGFLVGHPKIEIVDSATGKTEF